MGWWTGGSERARNGGSAPEGDRISHAKDTARGTTGGVFPPNGNRSNQIYPGGCEARADHRDAADQDQRGGADGLRVAVLVNDFGSINIDADLVVGVENEGNVISLANGCS